MHTTDHIVIIGSGIGGLTAAIILAKLGYRVTVVEKNKVIGGLMRSYTRGGIECEVGVHYIGAMDTGQPLRQVFDFIGVSDRIPLIRMGNEGVVDKYILPDMVFDFPPGIDLFGENLHNAFPDEGRQIAEIIAVIRDAIPRLNNISIFVREETEFDFSRRLRSLNNYFNELGCSSKLRSILRVPLPLIGVGLDECPVYLWSSLIASYLISSWRLARGGAHMADTLADRLRELGGEIICNDGVSKIVVRDRTVHGVVLKSGKELASPAVIAAIHPKLMLGLLPDNSYKPSFKNRILSLQETPGIFATHVAVPENEFSYKPYNIFVPDDVLDLHSGITFFHIKKSPEPGWNTISIFKESPYENWRRWENTTSECRPAEYKKAKNREADILLDKASKILGPMHGACLVDSFTPLSLLDWTGSPLGGAYGVRRSVAQKFKTAALHRTPIAGLHAVGQSVFAPGILGTVMGTLRVLAPLVGRETLHQKFIDAGIEGI